ncbi:hypothetical protein MP228_009700 [Amoeboaphelidium protococcarum]|nr:hypothetical protein MP228_009700 [Amoeboaphelidium protococcarum]
MNLMYICALIILALFQVNARPVADLLEEQLVLTQRPLLINEDSAASSTGKEEGQQRIKIVGGKEVNPKFKYGNFLAAISDPLGNHICGGTLLDKDILITAGHCSVYGIPLDQLRVYLHRHNLTKTSAEEDGVEFKVTKMVIHPDFNLAVLANDIALWKLTPKDPSAVVSKSLIQLDDGTLSGSDGTIVSAIGFGATYEGGEMSEVLREVELPIVNHEYCKEQLGSRVSDSMMCAGGRRNFDACQGDSGSSLIYQDARSNRTVLVGIVSWGRGCARNVPGVYTRISSFRRWIVSTAASMRVE